jgi:homoserine dehydrogenase
LASVDVNVALLGYGTVGSSVSRMLAESGSEIERATGHRLRVVRALVQDLDKERAFPAADGVLTTDFAAVRDDPSIDVVAEVMGGVRPAGDYVRELLRAGKPVVSANKQLVAREGAELFATASAAGVQLRFEASVCAAIPVVKVLRESLVATNVHRILGIVNGTTNFILSEMERGAAYAEALAAAQERGYAEADPTDDVEGIDAAAKMSILATVAFGSRVTPDQVDTRGITEVRPAHVAAAAELGMVVRLVGIATLSEEEVDVRVQPAFVERSHPLAAVDGPFNAVMLQGDAIREITLEGPGAGGTETASAVVADLVSVVGTAGTGFLQNDACWRELRLMDAATWRSPFYVHLDVADEPGVLAHAASRLAAHNVSVARLVQRLEEGRASLNLVLHEVAFGDVRAALAEIAVFPEVLDRPFLAPVIR